MSMELTIQPFDAAAVQFNKAEMAAAVAAITERYAGLVVTDKAEAKKDRAEVSRILKQIDDARKTVKKKYEAPLKQFEADIKEVVEPLKAAGAAIDAQIKTIEETERNKRRKVLEAVYADMKPYTPFSRVFDESLTNLSISEKKAVERLIAAINAAEADLRVIRSSNSDNVAALVDRYNSGATLAEVLAYDAQLKQTAQTFTISGTETPQEIIAELEQENPRNEYTVTDTGIQVVGKPTARHILLTCTDGQLDEVTRLMDRLGVFYVVED